MFEIIGTFFIIIGIFFVIGYIGWEIYLKGYDEGRNSILKEDGDLDEN